MDQNNTQQKPLKQKMYWTDLFPQFEKENLTNNINLSGLPDIDSKNTINLNYNLHDPLHNMPHSKAEVEKIFLSAPDKVRIELLHKYQNLDQIIRQLKSWQKYKTKSIKADTTIPGNKTLPQYFRKFTNTSITSINEDTNVLEH